MHHKNSKNFLNLVIYFRFCDWKKYSEFKKISQILKKELKPISKHVNFKVHRIKTVILRSIWNNFEN